MVTRRTRSHIPPSGLDKGTWDYIREPAIAAQYDAGLVGDLLTKQDATIVENLLANWPDSGPPVVADFGCGTGRSILPALERGCTALAIDLSEPMLSQVRSKATGLPGALSQQLLVLQANLLELHGVRSDSVDFALCLYSTFGMIRGRANRAKFLQHAVRILKPGGLFLLHGHNLWWQLNFPGGWRWLVGNRLQSWLKPGLEFGDRFADQRTIRQLPIHSFTLAALRHELNSAGFELEQIHPLEDPGGYRSWLVRLVRIRTQGWTLVLRSPSATT
jgi:SAM-dependent methyltransferase